MGGGGVVDLFQKYSLTYDFGSIASDTFLETTLTATGVSVGDFVFTGTPPGLDQHLLSSARVTASNVITLRVYNMDKNNFIDPASDIWHFLVVSFS